MATPSPIRSVSSAGFFFSRHLRLPGALRELAYSVVPVSPLKWEPRRTGPCRSALFCQPLDGAELKFPGRADGHRGGRAFSFLGEQMGIEEEGPCRGRTWLTVHGRLGR